MTEAGPLNTVDARVEACAMICAKAMEHGLDLPDVYIDPITFPVNVAQQQPGYMMEVLAQLQDMADPPPRSIVGLSNVSQGTTQRHLINRIMLVLLIGAGLDAAIVDVLDTDLMDAAICAEMLLNKQLYSDSFLKAGRM